MPEYEDLVARALSAQERARSFTVDAARVSSLARILREARTGGTMLVHCAWCGRLQVGGDWLRLDAIAAARPGSRSSSSGVRRTGSARTASNA
ncbi:MAG TPA: hypothetical protein VGK69_11475 [Gaiellaceae bacterium]